VRLTRLVPEAHVIGMADEVCGLAYAFRAPSLVNDLAMPICAHQKLVIQSSDQPQQHPQAQAQHRKGSPRTNGRVNLWRRCGVP
jgi:hypothetical protein